MAPPKKGKHAVVVSVSSSSDEEENADENSESDAEDSDEEYSFEGDDEDDSSQDEDADGGDGGGDGDDALAKPSDDDRCAKAIQLLRGRKSLDMLKLEDYKAYLRKHELRVSGTKATCIARILEHWRIKDGNGEKLYPRSSFNINCTGDVCKGDVILFKQLVYEKFDIVTRGGDIIGKRTIAGRVVKESYGAAKQQHTFTVEIMWSKGVKPLAPLYPLLVKGRNLYRLKTFRQRWKCTLILRYEPPYLSGKMEMHIGQPWNNEAERSKVLAEKHRRGAAARHIRAIAKAKAANKGTKCRSNSSNKSAPPKKRRKINSEPATFAAQQKNSARMFPLNNTEKQKVLSDSHARIKQGAKKRQRGLSARNPKQTNNHNHHPVIDQYNLQSRSHHFHNIAPVQPNMGTSNFPTYNVGYPSTRNRVLQHTQVSRGNDIGHSYATYTSQFDPRSSSYPYASYGSQFVPRSSSDPCASYASPFVPRSSSYPYARYTSQFDPGSSSHQQRQLDFSGNTLPLRLQVHRGRQP